MQFKIIRRTLCILLSAAVVLPVLCSCAGEKDEERVTLRVVTTLGDNELYAVYSSLLLAFTQEHKDIIIKDTTVRQSEAYKLDLSSASTYTAQDSPDIIYAPVGLVEEMYDFFVPLRDISDAYPEYTESISKAAIKSVSSSAARSYCLPVIGEYYMIVENGAFADSYFSPVISATDLLSAGQGTAGANMLLFANSPSECAPLLQQIVLSLGGEQALGLSCRRDPATLDGVWVQALDIFSQLCASKVISDYGELNNTDSLELFASGKSAMLVCSSRDAVRLPSAMGYRVIVFMTPDGSGGYSSVLPGGFSGGFFITAKAFADPAKREAAISFITELTSPRAGALYSGIGYISSNTNTVGLIAKPVSATVQMTADEADGFTESMDTVNSVFWDDLRKRLDEVSGRLIAPSQAAELLKTPSAKISDLPPVSPTDLTVPQ